MSNYSKLLSEKCLSQTYKMYNTFLLEEAPYSEMLFTIQELTIDNLNY